jgi:hypothetical protein
MYFDIHGHQSAKPSFLFGNYTEKISEMTENKLFCKLLENNFIPGAFFKN